MRCWRARRRAGYAGSCCARHGFPCPATFVSSCGIAIHRKPGQIAAGTGGSCAVTANPTELSDRTARMTQENERKLAEVFRAVLKLAPDSDVTGVRQLNTATWDSLAHVS